MSFIVRRLKTLRLGAVAGYNASENNMKMSLVVIAPIIAVWFVVKMMLPDEFYYTGMTIGMVVWFACLLSVYNWAKGDAGNYIVFAGSKWKFPDGSCRTFDLKVPPDSWEKIAEFEDGSIGYKVHFADKFLYEDPDLPYARVFSKAYWLLPALWDKCFQRRAVGEFFHKGIFVTKPDCEDISVYVIGWEVKEGESFPVCLINDCALTYQRTFNKAKTPQFIEGANEADLIFLLYKDGRKREDKLLAHSSYLEERLEVAESDASKDFKESAEGRMKATRQRHGRIMDVRESWRAKIFTLRNVFYAVVIFFVIAILGRILFGWW